MALVELGGSVGANGNNFFADVSKISAALTAIGPSRGGVSSPPLSIPELTQAIRNFQTFQTLAVRDGRVDRSGNTIKRINAILNGGVLPTPPQPPSPVPQAGGLRQINPTGTKDSVGSTAWIPVENSLTSETVFKWSSIGGKGRVFYFELGEKVVPNWFGILVPDSVTDFSNIHIFFHPTPSQAGYVDALYQAKTGWSGVFHYLSDDFATQFCAANSNQVLVMPLMTTGVASTGGIFTQRWESLVGQMLGQIASGGSSASPISISSVVVSSFSSGIAYSAAFRNGAQLGGKLRGIIDFDGIFSTFRGNSISLPTRAVRMWQTGLVGQGISALAAQNMFPLPQPRWTDSKGPYAGRTLTPLQIHAVIPQMMMFTAAQRTRA